MNKVAEVQKLYDKISTIVWETYPHVIMLMPIFFDDGSGKIICVGDEPNLFAWDSLDDFIDKANQWILLHSDYLN